MERNEFLKKSIIGLGGVVALTSVFAKGKNAGDDQLISEACPVSPKETKGPFPNKTPSDYLRENIIGDRKGIPLLMTITILDKTKGCDPLSDALVDVWHCDSQGNYSEYDGYGMQSSDFTEEHFLRGRQITDKNGRISFISLYPGYYHGRAPHIHLEVLSRNQKSLLSTQIAFPEDVCDMIYATEYYQKGTYMANINDSVFNNSLEQNLADSVVGNIDDGYTLLKTIVVAT